MPFATFYVSLRVKIMNQSESFTVEIDSIPVHCTRQGSGAPVLLLHGWGCNTDTMASIAATVAQTNTAISVDFPGFGLTPEPDSVWGVEQYTRLIEKLAKKLGLQCPTLIGHSFGGRVSIVYASRNATDKVILVDAAGVPPIRPIKYYFKVYSYKLLKRLTLLIYGKDKGTRRIQQMQAKRGSADYAAASPRMRAILSKVVNEDLRSLMPSIEAPTLLIWGENDTATPMRDARIMEKLIPGAALVSFPGCGHYSFLDNPRQFAAVLNSFLKS